MGGTARELTEVGLGDNHGPGSAEAAGLFGILDGVHCRLNFCAGGVSERPLGGAGAEREREDEREEDAGQGGYGPKRGGAQSNASSINSQK